MRPHFGLLSLLTAFAILGTGGSIARAQASVPGGWDAQFSYQSFGPTVMGSGSSSLSGTSPYGMFGSPFGYGVSPYGSGNAIIGGPIPTRPNLGGYSFGAGAPLTMDGSVPLINAVRQSTRSARRR